MKKKRPEKTSKRDFTKKIRNEKKQKVSEWRGPRLPSNVKTTLHGWKIVFATQFVPRLCALNFQSHCGKDFTFYPTYTTFIPFYVILFGATGRTTDLRITDPRVSLRCYLALNVSARNQYSSEVRSDDDKYVRIHINSTSTMHAAT